MKLSEIKGERVIDVIAEITEPIANIAMDKEAAALFKKKKVPKGMDANEFIVRRIKASVPPLLKSHKEDMISIMASIEGIEREEYVNTLNMATFIKGMIELLSDEVFIGLFT